MERDTTSSNSRDILSNPRLAFVLFWLPAIAIGVTGTSIFDAVWRTIVWTLALSTMGGACIVNAVQCRRVHCYLTGPFFLVMAVVTLLYGLGVVPLGANGCNLIGLTIPAGAIVLCCLPEPVLGKYREARGEDRR